MSPVEAAGFVSFSRTWYLRIHRPCRTLRLTACYPESWRLPIGASGLLDFFLGILSSPDLRQPLKIHALRFVGNSCADTGTQLHPVAITMLPLNNQTV